MKRLLIVSGCSKRGSSTGLVGKLLDSLKDIDKEKYEVSLFDTGFFDVPHNPEDYPVTKYFGLPKYKIEKIIRKVPYLRSKYSEWLIIRQFRQILSHNHFNLVAIYQIPTISKCYIKIAHQKGSKVIMYPFGSDILVATKGERRKIRKAFDCTDFVGGAPKSNCSLSMAQDYHVPEYKFIYSKQYISGVGRLQALTGTKSRVEMQEALGLPKSDYNIVIGYNGYPTHRQNIALDAIIANKGYLPANYLLIFPMGYGLDEEYLGKLKEKCNSNGINSIFFSKFLSNEQMTYLHLVTDLFINIQTSDCGNAFMIEALYAGNNIITGRWLKYEQFEQFGEPYILVDNPEDLTEKLRNVFTSEIEFPKIPEALHQMFEIPANYTPGSYWTDILDKI